ncbi:M48 family metalloprotease [Spirillospora sp. CA-253888]
MTIVLRALVAVLLLAGYYALTAAVLAVAGLAVYWMARDPGLPSVKAGLLALFISVPLLGALVRTARHRPERPSGRPVPRAEEPRLWAAVDELAARVGTRPPDEILLVPDVNAAVTEETRWFGLRPGRRTMLVGVPLLETLTVDQMRAVLGHELGHYGGSHTRLGGITYRGATALRRTVDALGGDEWFQLALRKLFEGYAVLYFRVSQAVRRRQEIEADAFMVEIAGRDAAGAALRSVRATAPAWAFFLNRLAGSGVRYGLAPADLFGGFRAFLAEPSRQGELAELLAEPEERDPYDSHPTLADRLAAIAARPEPSGLVLDDRPAAGLLTDPARLRADVQEAMFGDGTALDWDELAARSMELEAAEDGLRLLAALERLTGVPDATLGALLDTVERAQGPRLAAELTGGDPDRLPTGRDAVLREAALRGHVQSLVASALLRVPGVGVRFSWSGSPARLTGPDGTELDLDAIVPEGFGAVQVPALRGWLAQWGADPAHRPERPERTSVDLVGALYGVSEDGDFYDVLVLDVGLLFARISTLEAMRGSTSTAPVRERVQKLLEHSPGELLDREGNWLLVPDRVTKAVFSTKKDKWRVEFELSWTDDDGVGQQAAVHVKGDPPCTPPREAEEILRSLLGSRVTAA